jgi:hypothetical protein
MILNECEENKKVTFRRNVRFFLGPTPRDHERSEYSPNNSKAILPTKYFINEVLNCK